MNYKKEYEALRKIQREEEVQKAFETGVTVGIFLLCVGLGLLAIVCKYFVG